MNCLLATSTLSVDGGSRYRLRVACGEKGSASDILALFTDLAYRSTDDVVDQCCIDSSAFDYRLEAVGEEVDGVDAVQGAVRLSLADRSANGFDDNCVSHDKFLSGMADSAGTTGVGVVAGVIPSDARADTSATPKITHQAWRKVS